MDLKSSINSSFLFAYSLVILNIIIGCSEDTSVKKDKPRESNIPLNYTLFFSDEFNGKGQIDSSKWSFDLGSPLIGGTVWGNNENQHYTSESDNVFLSGGYLNIQAVYGKPAGSSNGVFASSARITSNNSNFYQSIGNNPYGFYEIRAKIPCVKGAWPAIWLLGKDGTWPDRGELDIMEWYGRYSDQYTSTSVVHTKSFSGDVSQSPYGQYGSQKIDSLCSDFQRFQVNWKENEIIFSVNDVETFTYTKRSHFTINEWPFDQPAYLIMNVAVGGNLGGTVDINDIPDMRMMIDYVRVYKAPSD